MRSSRTKNRRLIRLGDEAAGPCTQEVGLESVFGLGARLTEVSNGSILLKKVGCCDAETSVIQSV
jgi:hypothetical protein